MWIFELLLGLLRNTDFFFGMLAVIGLKIVAGIFALLYLSIFWDGAGLLIFPSFCMVVIFGLLHLVLQMENTIMIHIINFSLVLLGSVLFLVFRGDIAFFILIGFSVNIVFQIALYHEIDISEALLKIDLSQWERRYLHFCPNFCFFLKYFYKKGFLELLEEEQTTF